MPALEPIISKLPMDWVILALFAVVVTIVTLRLGTQGAVAFSLAAPMTIFIYSGLPWTAFIGPYTGRLVNPEIQIMTVGAMLLALCILIYKMLPHSVITGSLPIQAILAGVAAAAVLAVVLLQLPALGKFLPVSPLMHTVFGPSYNTFWILAAYLSLAIARR